MLATAEIVFANTKAAPSVLRVLPDFVLHMEEAAVAPSPGVIRELETNSSVLLMVAANVAKLMVATNLLLADPVCAQLTVEDADVRLMVATSRLNRLPSSA